MSERRSPSAALGHEQTKTQHATGDRSDVRPCFSVLVSGACGAFCLALPDADAVVLGREDTADVVVDDPSVSRRHVVLYLRDELQIEELGSKNGTRVNGVPLRSGTRERIECGAVIELGTAIVVLQRGTMSVQAASSVRGGRSALPAEASSDDPPVAENPAMKHLYELLGVVAPTPLSLLVIGETGVGKEVFARCIHRSSPRSERAFLSLNCAALPDSVLEGELFGYEKGAFTGAVQARPGLFEAANGGTLFLDEIGELPLATQAKLLRVLENGEVLRLGSRKPVRVDVRIVAATNCDLRAMVLQSSFRADLYFRLNGMTLTIPPLRQRREDILPLAQRFLAAASARLGRPAPLITPDAQAVLETYAWPGNVREVRNVMERAAALCQAAHLGSAELCHAAPELSGEHPSGEAAGAIDLAPASRSEIAAPLSQPGPPSGALRNEIESFEKERVLAALATTHGNQKRAAEMLGISRRTLINRLDQYGIGRPRKAPL